ncbi:hypothetical protein [Actinospica robiniae]|uniref:hypothetical protein n=1 Tax=Actinospica robiniae TaxID=304901 RepID=UPI0004219F00|nr:hypothetical protein [Actinospica robiniae]
MLATMTVAVLGAVSACSGPATSMTSSHHVTPSIPAPTSVSPSGTLDPQAQAALAAYREAWQDLAIVSDEGNYQDPRLSAHLSGQLLLTTSQDLYLEESHGIASKGAPILHPRVVGENLSARPPTVAIADCIDFRQFVQYYKTTGQPFGTAQKGMSADLTTMSTVTGVWSVTTQKMQADGSCTA